MTSSRELDEKIAANLLRQESIMASFLDGKLSRSTTTTKTTVSGSSTTGQAGGQSGVTGLLSAAMAGTRPVGSPLSSLSIRSFDPSSPVKSILFYLFF